MGPPGIGDRAEQPLLLDAAAIRSGARLVGDMNPLHHDEAFARRSRFAGLIASGAHTAALLVGMLGQHFGNDSTDGAGLVGVDYSVQFRAPVRVDCPMRMQWEVTGVEPRRGGKTLVRMEGGIVGAADGAPAIMAKITMLYLG
jgi:3-hydroxybutyryl-CoA dehydratase